MANRVNVDLDMNVQGYVDGMDKATQSTAAYETETKKVKDEQLNLNKELRKAKTDARNLAATYALLDKQAKQSQFGREIAKQLEEAKQKAAELIDINSDLQEELKNRASDTATFDAFVDGVSGLTSGLSAATGVLGIFTKNTETMTRAITLFTTAESIASAAIKAKNLLQKQSSLMLAINKIQQEALTAATVKGTAATEGATIAQRAFNLVAKANPYVLLFTGLTAVIGAIGTYVLLTNKAESATEKLKKEMHETSLQAQKDAQTEITKLDLLYNATQNTKLAIDERRRAAEQLQDMYPAYFGNLKTEEILVGKASDAYKQLKDDIIAVAMARAYQDKITEKAKENVDLEDQLEKAEKELEKKRKQRNSNQGGFTPGAYSPAATAGELWDLQGAQNDIDELKNKIKENNDAMSSYQDKINETADAQRRLSDGNKALAGSIADVNNQLSRLQDRFNNGYISKEDYNKQKALLDKQLKDLKSGTDLANKSGGGKNTNNTTDSYEKDKINLEEQYKNQLIDELSYKEKLASLEKAHLETLLKSNKATDADVERYQNAKAAYEQIKISTQYQDELNNAQTAYNHGILTEAEYLTKVANVNKSIYEANLKNGTATEQLAQNYLKAKQAAVDASKTIRESLEDQLKAIEDRLSNGENLTVEVRTQLMQDANRIQEQLNKISATSDLTIPAKVEPKYVIKGSFEDIKQSVKNGIQEINDIADAYDLGIIDYDTAKKRIENINKQLVELGAKEYKIKIESEFGTQLQSFLDGAGEFSGVINSVDSVVGAFDRLNTAIKEGKSGWEQFVASVNVAMSIIQSISTVMTILNSIQDAMNITTEAAATIKAKDTAATIASATAADVAAASTGTLAAANTAAVAPMIALATATKKLAAAQIFQAHASIPFVGPPAAAAGVAMMEATLAAIQAFANGGIVNGSSYSGDKVIARVNSGEMILNKRQQQNLFNLLDYGSTTHSNANIIPEVKIKGSDLYIAFRNYSSIESKLGKNIGIH